MVRHFGAIGRFETITPNDPKMTLTTETLNITHIHFKTTPNSQIALRFDLWTAILELQIILIQVHRMTPKWLWTRKGKRHPIYMLQLPPESQFLRHFTLRTAVFELQTILDKCTNWPKMILNTKMSKITHIHSTTTSESQISLRFTLSPTIFKLQAIWRQLYPLTPNDL